MDVKKLVVIVILLGLLFLVAFQFKPVAHLGKALVTNPSYVNKPGLTIKSRVKIPEGFSREPYPKGSFQEYIRNYALKPFGAKVINYDGSLYFNQIGHIGVLELSVPNGLQQCADALIRLRSEYLWSINQKDKIGFNFTSGDYCSWEQYAKGYRPKLNGDRVTFHKIAKVDRSKANFYRYLNLIYMYAGTLSLYHEMPKITDIHRLQVGDMLIVGGSPGHVVMIADVITNGHGDKRFLLLQGEYASTECTCAQKLRKSLAVPLVYLGTAFKSRYSSLYIL